MMRNIAVIGLGYVGLPVAAAFSAYQHVIAFDINKKRISELKAGYDYTKEVSTEVLSSGNFLFTSNDEDLKNANFFIVAVPTPVDNANKPDLGPILLASKTIAPYLKMGDIVVYESTVYPGATEEICVPVLEQYSDLKCGTDFFVGYSPERINPGDKEHVFTKITKIVSGQTPEILNIIADVYGSVIEAGVYKASSIKVAEAAKVIENTQRDLNIAFVNELAMICHSLNIDTMDVLNAAGTKWNFLPFKPGLVGGHCIGVDPYYLTYKAESIGLHPQVILAGRRVNDEMGKYIATQTIKLLAQKGVSFSRAKIGVLGLAFKENCSDIRNTKVIDIILELQEYGCTVLTHDPLVRNEIAQIEYGITLYSFDELVDLDAIILAVSHNDFKFLSINDLGAKLTGDAKLIVDVKSSLQPEVCQNENIMLWRL